MKPVNSAEIKVACTGSGYFSQFQYQSWNRLDGVRVVGAMARSLESAQKTGAPAFDDLERMLHETKPDLLDIITPPVTHLNFIKIAVANDVERIICQKPFCQTLEEAREAVTLCAAHNVDLVIHENFRFQPWYRAIKQELDAGRVGDLHQMTFRLRTGDGQGPNAYMDRQPYFQEMPRLLIHETGVHWVDTFCFLLGKPDWVIADLRKMNPVIAGEDAGYFLFGYKDGRRALFDGNRLLDHQAENTRKTLGECLVEGTEATMSLSGNGLVTHRAFGAQSSTVILEEREWPGFAGDCVHALQKHVVAAMRNGLKAENTGKDYLQVLQIVSAIYESSHRGCRIEIA